MEKELRNKEWWKKYPLECGEVCNVKYVDVRGLYLNTSRSWSYSTRENNSFLGGKGRVLNSAEMDQKEEPMSGTKNQTNSGGK